MDSVVPVSTTRTAEAVKITENIFRAVNIALVNELKQIFEPMDIDVHEALDAAARKPFGFMKFSPGPGLGGHCIPIDPFYLTWKAREFGKHTRFIELVGEINTQMPKYVIGTLQRALNSHKKPINGTKVLVLGVAYKPDIDDERESPALEIIDELRCLGADVSFYDPYISVLKETRKHPDLAGQESISWNRETIARFDAAVIVTDHTDIDYYSLSQWVHCIVDTRNVMVKFAPHVNHVWKA
jgi:UDP-N-acetyl-D-glucosamine dehydrogenase